MGHVARTPAPGDLFAGFERYNGMTPPFGITMLRLISLRCHRPQGGLIGFDNVAIGILFDSLSCRRMGSRPELCPFIRKHLSTYFRAIALAHGVVCHALFSVGVGTMLHVLHPTDAAPRPCPLWLDLSRLHRPAAPTFPAQLATDRQSLAASAKPDHGWPGTGRSEERPSFDGLRRHDGMAP
jgi:hypothetical protein